MSGVHQEVPTEAGEPSRDSPTFRSILFLNADVRGDLDRLPAPEFFKDLNLNQVVDAICEGFGDYNLVPLFYIPLKDLDSIAYRQEIVHDLENRRLTETLQSFSAQMLEMRGQLKQSDELYYKYAMERAFLGAAATYCNAVKVLARELVSFDLKSRGLRRLCEFVAQYVNAGPFRILVEEEERLISGFSKIRYCLLVKDESVTVRRCEEESDYSVSVDEAFAKFTHETNTSRRIKVPPRPAMNHIQAQVLDGVASLYPESFHGLDAFKERHATFLDPAIARFEREIQFYFSYASYTEKFRRAGLNFSLPRMSQTSKEVYARKAFDLALADKLLGEKATVVSNDFFLHDAERILVVSGPNQGGKTTFARMFGQLHYLGSLGCPVPGTQASLFLCDQIFTHFEREESLANLRGKLYDDLVRVRAILDQATPDSIVILNEVFSSTTSRDAVELSKRIMEKITQLDALCVWVTFLDELASFNQKTVSVVSTVDRLDPSIRTYRLERRPADGLAYAHALAEKYGVTYRQLKERIPR